MPTTTAALDDRRSTIVAAAVVAAVVVVLGFGSGFRADLARTVGSNAAAPTGRDLGTVVQPGPVSLDATSGAATGEGGAQRISSVQDAATSSSTATTVATSTGGTHVTSTTVGATTTTLLARAPVTAASCSSGVVAPFWVHLEKAHLETSPGQQVTDALSVDQYVKTHTVLLEAMFTPIINAVFGDADSPGPFWTHLEKAHLETSPGEQVAQALSLDQYVKTHTVLVEDILSPIVGDC